MFPELSYSQQQSATAKVVTLFSYSPSGRNPSRHAYLRSYLQDDAGSVELFTEISVTLVTKRMTDFRVRLLRVPFYLNTCREIFSRVDVCFNLIELHAP